MDEEQRKDYNFEIKKKKRKKKKPICQFTDFGLATVSLVSTVIIWAI